MHVAVSLLVTACAATPESSAPIEGASSVAPISAAPEPRATLSPTPRPTPELPPGSIADCALDLTLSGAIDLTFPETVRSQLGWAGDPEAWGMTSQAEAGDEVSLTLPDGTVVQSTWSVSLSDTDGDGPRDASLFIHLLGPTIWSSTSGPTDTPRPSGGPGVDVVGTGRPSFDIALGWSEDTPPGMSPVPAIGFARFDGRYAASFDLEFNWMQARSLSSSVTALPEGIVRAVGAVDCMGGV